MIRSPLVALLLFGASLWLIAVAIRLLIQGGEVTSTYTFRRINTYLFLVMFLASLDSLFI